jgi:hypothetical protein
MKDRAFSTQEGSEFSETAGACPGHVKHVMHVVATLQSGLYLEELYR